MKHTIKDANFPVDEEGRVYHVSVKRGEVANRIVTAGDPIRVRRFARFLDETPVPFELVSARGFTTITGRYKGVPITLMAIGMGFPMMDFMIREVRHIIDGDMAVIRFGSCGSVDPTLPVGSVGVPRCCMTINTNYAHWGDDGEPLSSVSPFIFSQPIPSNPILHQALLASLNDTISPAISEIRDIKLHASADLFYSNQGRIDSSFEDDNESFLVDLHTQFPDLTTLEMETAHLFHLARIGKKKGQISAAAAHMIFASRNGTDGHDFIGPDQLALLEPLVGRACMDAVVAMDLKNVHPEEDAVWSVGE